MQVDPFGDLNTELERALGKLVEKKYNTGGCKQVGLEEVCGWADGDGTQQGPRPALHALLSSTTHSTLTAMLLPACRILHAAPLPAGHPPLLHHALQG